MALLTKIYGQNRNDRKARQPLKERLQIMFPKLLFLSYNKNTPQIVTADINNISCTGFIRSSKEKIFRFVGKELRTDMQNMMQVAPSLTWPPKPEDLFATDRQPLKSLKSFLEQLLQFTHHTTGEMVKQHIWSFSQDIVYSISRGTFFHRKTHFAWYEISVCFLFFVIYAKSEYIRYWIYWKEFIHFSKCSQFLKLNFRFEVSDIFRTKCHSKKA